MSFDKTKQNFRQFKTIVPQCAVKRCSKGRKTTTTTKNTNSDK